MSDPSWLQPHPDGVVVDVWVVPGASREEITGLHDGAVRVRVTAPAEGGKANRAVTALLVAAFGAGGAEVVAGGSGRRKRVLLAGVTPGAAADRLRRMG